jgi:hypothetical protein
MNPVGEITMSEISEHTENVQDLITEFLEFKETSTNNAEWLGLEFRNEVDQRRDLEADFAEATVAFKRAQVLRQRTLELLRAQVESLRVEAASARQLVDEHRARDMNW